jgi:hypothetical protein
MELYLVLLAVGFVLGYGVREAMSQRRPHGYAVKGPTNTDHKFKKAGPPAARMNERAQDRFLGQRAISKSMVSARRTAVPPSSRKNKYSDCHQKQRIVGLDAPRNCPCSHAGVGETYFAEVWLSA